MLSLEKLDKRLHDRNLFDCGNQAIKYCIKHHA